MDDADIDPISLEKLTSLYDRQTREPGKRHLLVLDSRSDPDYERAHIAGAEHLQIFDVNPDLGRDPRIDSFDTIVVYGDNPGSATAKALTKRLMRLRYDDVFMFAGGLDAWRGAGLPVEGGD